MLRNIGRIIVAFAVCSASLAAAPGLAADSNESIDVWPSQANAAATPEEASGRRAASADETPAWQRPPQAGVPAWSEGTPAATRRPASQPMVNAFGYPRPVASSYRPQPNVRLAANVDAAPELPQPERHATAGAMPPAEAADGTEPHCACGSQGYWRNDYDYLVCNKWYGGADYLLLRPHQAADTAFVVSPNGGSGSAIQNVNFDASYASNFRAFFGWEIDDTHSVRFTFTHIFNDSLQSATVADGNVILSPLGANLNPGDSIDATQHLMLNLWDIESVRKLEIPTCVCGGCPGWEINWSWGVRIIDLEEAVKNEVNGLDAGVFSQKSTFSGAGPRIGFEAHRQLGGSRMSSFFGADAALLLGGLDTTGSDTPTGLTSAQIVPNFDLRLGLCWQPTCNGSLSVGWMFETYGDVTMLNQNATLAGTVGPQTNSISYDGLFVRGEMHF